LAITSEGIAQDPYAAARGGVSPATFCTEGIEHHHSTNHVSQIMTFNSSKCCWKWSILIHTAWHNSIKQGWNWKEIALCYYKYFQKYLY